MTDRASPPLPRPRQPATTARGTRAGTALPADLRGALTRGTAAAGPRLRLDKLAVAPIALELLPPDYYIG